MRTWVLRTLTSCAAVGVTVPVASLGADPPTTADCTVCDIAVYVKVAIQPCFVQKTDRYIAEAESGPILVDYGTCEQPTVDEAFHAPKPRLPMPVIENKCAKDECASAAADYLFLLSKTQLLCLKAEYPKAFDAQGERVKVDLSKCK